MYLQIIYHIAIEQKFQVMGRKEFYDRLEELNLIKQKANLKTNKASELKEDKLFKAIKKRKELSKQSI